MCHKLRFVFVSILGVILLSSFNNRLAEEAEVFLSLSCKKPIPMYKTASKQKVIKYLGHNFKEEDYLLFTIKNSNDSMYYVEAFYAIAGNNKKGWISKGVKIGIFSKIYKGKLSVYNFPDRKSNKTSLSYMSDELSVMDYRDGWLKVKIFIKGNNVIGWLAPEDQCSNPYTTCD